MKQTKDFSLEVSKNIETASKDKDFLDLSDKWIRTSIRHKYAYNFSWLGRPIMQVPQDIYAIQEIVWTIKPDLIIETGIAHGGSLIMSASMLALIDYCEAVNQTKVLDVQKSIRCVLGIDIEIRPHNRKAIEAHPMAHLIEMIEGSSIEPDIVEQVKEKAKGHEKILIFLDSNHTHSHVLAELEAYASLTSVGSYCVVWDTGIEDLPAGFCTGRPWGKGNNPKTAVFDFLRTNDDFIIDRNIDNKLLITGARDGFLKRTK
jgi:cephalosporin hydroxylase